MRDNCVIICDKVQQCKYHKTDFKKAKTLQVFPECRGSVHLLDWGSFLEKEVFEGSFERQRGFFVDDKGGTYVELQRTWKLFYAESAP